MALAEIILVFAIMFFEGFGWGSERHDIQNVSTVLIFLNFLANIAENNYTRMFTYPPTIILISAVIATALLLIDVGVGYYIGKRWFRRTH